VRFLVLLALTSPAFAEHVISTGAEALGTREARLTALMVPTPHVDLECGRITFLEGDAGFRGSFLGVAWRFGQVWFGVHLVSTEDRSYRYLTPSAGIGVGPATLAVRSTGLFAGSVGDAPARTITKDWDVDVRVALPVELRGRIRDVDMGDTWLRDVFVGAGRIVSPIGGRRASMPVFVGIGVRRELWRDTITVEEVPMQPAGWEAFAWIEVGLALERVQ
jgi:hypothetical protein